MAIERLAGRTAFITGGGSGIGRAIARRFVAEGCRVAICGRDETKLKAVHEELNRTDRLRLRICDVTDPVQVKQTVQWAAEQWGRIDILVNNAGANVKQRAVRDLNTERWRHLLSANLDAAFYCIQEILPGMRERRDGLIINISSVAGKRATPLSGAAYAAAKFGMNALSICLGVEEKEHNIRCTAICPGEVDTPILEQRPVAMSPEQRRLILQPEDVAEAALFVAALPPRASVPELIIKPTSQAYM